RLAVPDEVVDRLGGQDGEVAAGAAFELLEETIRGAPGDHNFRTAGALECGYEVEHDRLHTVGADDFHCGDPFTFPTSFRVDAGWAEMPLLSPERESQAPSTGRRRALRGCDHGQRKRAHELGRGSAVPDRLSQFQAARGQGGGAR